MPQHYTEAQQRAIVKKVDQFKAKGLTLPKAAKKAGIHYTSYYAWQKKLSPVPKTTNTPVTFHPATSPIKRTYKKKVEPTTSKVAIVICDATDVANILSQIRGE